MMIMLGKKRPFSSPSEADGGEFVTPSHSPSPSPSPVPNTTTGDSDSSTVTNTSSSGAVTTPTSSDIEFMEEEVRLKRMVSLTSSSSSGSSNQEVVLNPRRRSRRRLCPPPRSLLSSSPTSCSADLLVGEGHRVSNLEEIVRVLKRMHSSLRLRREYWTSPPTGAELRLHHLILIHVNSYISLFDIEQSDDARALAFSPLQQQEGDVDDLDLEELYDALDSKALPVPFANFLQEARRTTPGTPAR